MKKISVKAIAFGAICVCLSVILVEICMYIPLLGMFSVILSGIPLMLLGVKYGTRMSGIAFIASILLLFVLNGDILSVLMLGIMNLLPGVIIGYTVSRRFSFSNSIFAVSGAVLVGYAIQLWMIDKLNGGNGIEDMISQILDSSKNMMGDIISKLPTEAPVPMNELMANINTVMDKIQEMILLYMPTFFIGISVVLGYCAYMFGIFILGRLRFKRVMYIPFNRMIASRNMCYVAMILYIITAFSKEITPVNAVFINMSSLLYAFIGVCGLSFIDFKLSKKITSGYLRAIIYAVVFFIGYLMIGMLLHILILIGLADAMLNFRSLTKVGEDNGRK